MSINYSDKQLEDLKTNRDTQLKYLEHLNKQIEEIEKAKKENPVYDEFVGRFFIDSHYNGRVYAVLGPALTHNTKEVIPDKVLIYHHTVNESDDSTSIYKGQEYMELDFLVQDIEITEDEMNEIIKYWMDLYNKYDKKIKDLTCTFKEEMLRFSTHKAKNVLDKSKN